MTSRDEKRAKVNVNSSALMIYRQQIVCLFSLTIKAVVRKDKNSFDKYLKKFFH